jgi:hypothetical protein|tara:strand:+ start:7766 stop:8089 length:324 start_codon:yes stop_codon:yes gene_type:complete
MKNSFLIKNYFYVNLSNLDDKVAHYKLCVLIETLCPIYLFGVPYVFYFYLSNPQTLGNFNPLPIHSAWMQPKNINWKKEPEYILHSGSHDKYLLDLAFYGLAQAMIL